jgi:hypothetical protein
LVPLERDREADAGFFIVDLADLAVLVGLGVVAVLAVFFADPTF